MNSYRVLFSRTPQVSSGRFPKRRGVVLFALCIMLVSAAHAAEPLAPVVQSRVLAVNLWSGSLDLRLGSDGAFQTLGLRSLSASQIVEFSSIQNRSLMYRPAGSDTWQTMTEADGKNSMYKLAADKTYLILVHPDGKPGLYQLNVPKTDKPRMAVINATGKALSRLEIGLGWHEGTVAQAGGLTSGWTDFLALPEGNFAGFWSFETMPAGVSHYYTSGSDGLSLGLYPLRPASWYLFIIWDDPSSQGSGGIIWDVSPATVPAAAPDTASDTASPAPKP